MDEPQAAERLAPERKIVKSRQKDALGIAHHHMTDRALSGNQDADLPVEIGGHPGKVPGEFTGKEFIVHASSVDPLERMHLSSLQP
jgi:hypothetical protein